MENTMIPCNETFNKIQFHTHKCRHIHAFNRQSASHAHTCDLFMCPIQKHIPLIHKYSDKANATHASQSHLSQKPREKLDKLCRLAENQKGE